MPGRPSYAEINAVRALVSDGLSRLTGAVDDLEQFWIAAARTRLAQVDDLLVEAAGGIPAPVRVPATAIVWFGLVTVAATGAWAAGLGTAGTIVGTVLVALALTVVLPRLAARIASAANRRRLARSGATRQPAEADPATDLLALPEELLRARVRLVSIVLRRAGSRDWTAARMRRAVARDATVAALARADLLLCQAIDCLESYLDHLEKE